MAGRLETRGTSLETKTPKNRNDMETKPKNGNRPINREGLMETKWKPPAIFLWKRKRRSREEKERFRFRVIIAAYVLSVAADAAGEIWLLVRHLIAVHTESYRPPDSHSLMNAGRSP